MGENAGLGVEFGPDDVQAEPWSFGDYEGSLISTPTHLLHVTLPDGSLRQSLPIFTNRALDHYRTMIPTPSRPTERMAETLAAVERPWRRSRSRAADRTDELVRLRHPSPVGGVDAAALGRQAGLYLAIERGGYTIDAESVLWDIGRYDTLCMLAHEGWHQYTQTVFRHPLPTFLEEGLAAYAEGHSFRRRDTEPRFMPWRNLERYGQLWGPTTATGSSISTSS